FARSCRHKAPAEVSFRTAANRPGADTAPLGGLLKLPQQQTPNQPWPIKSGEDVMTRWLTLVIALSFFGIAAFQAPASAQDGWITLFDGTNLDQWTGDGKATFVIEDGAVIAKNKKDEKT